MRNILRVVVVVALIICLGVLSGCDRDDVPSLPVRVANPSVQTTVPQVEQPMTRFTLVSYGKFKAGYSNNEREILIMIDTVTKKEYIVITGCGVTEVVHKGKSVGEE